MNPTRWQFLRPIFEAALEQPTEARDDYLRDACADDGAAYDEIRSLLTAAGAAGTFLDPPTRLDAAPFEPPGLLEAGTEIDAYRIDRCLGEGGMGAVYLAHRDDDTYHQQVALKVIRSGVQGAAQARRFRAERQILASLDHPHIAKLLDGGSTPDGSPYLVMELIEGDHLLRYADDQGLHVTARLQLFKKVCGAVHHAHQRLVVHRDLKPSNILVNENGEPKLLDFGIAKLLENPDPDTANAIGSIELTAPGQWLMTPEYASPEQVRGEVLTTATDVYSLGVLLYELLTGARPYALPSRHPMDVIQTVCGKEPDLQQLRKKYPGDLENIVLKALSKEPERRYSSAEEFGRDIERHLDCRPVLARPATLGYRLQRFVRRHRAPVALASLLLVTAIAFQIALLVQQRSILNLNQQLVVVSDFLVDLFAIPDPNRSRGETVTAREVLDRGLATIDELASEPRARAALLAPIAESYKNLGLLSEAEPLVLETLDLRRGLLGDNHPAVTESLDQLTHLYTMTGDYKKAEPYGRQALERHRLEKPVNEPGLIVALYRLADILTLEATYDEAKDLYNEAAIRARDLGDPDLEATVKDRHGQLLTQTGELDEARLKFDEALTLYQQIGDAQHPELPTVQSNRALLELRFDPEKAETLLREAVAGKEKLFGPEHPSLANTLANLAFVVHQRDRLDEAEEIYQKALTLQRKLYQGEHPQTANTLNNLGELYAAQDELERAEALHQEALTIQHAQLGERHVDTARTLTLLGNVAEYRDQLDAAEAFYKKALETVVEVLGEQHFRTAVLLGNLASVAQSRDDDEAAADFYERSIAVCRDTPLGCQADIVYSLHNYGTLLNRMGDTATAREQFAAGLEAARTFLDENHTQVGMLLTRLARADNELGAYAQAAPEALEAMEILKESLGADSPWTLAASRAAGVALLELERYDEAEPLLRADYERSLERLGEDHARTQAARERLDRVESRRTAQNAGQQSSTE